MDLLKVNSRVGCASVMSGAMMELQGVTSLGDFVCGEFAGLGTTSSVYSVQCCQNFIKVYTIIFSCTLSINLFDRNKNEI